MKENRLIYWGGGTVILPKTNADIIREKAGLKLFSQSIENEKLKNERLTNDNYETN